MGIGAKALIWKWIGHNCTIQDSVIVDSWMD